MYGVDKCADDGLGSNSGPSGLFAVFLDLIRFRRIIFGGAIACGFVVAAYSFYVAPIYTAQTVILMPQQQQGAAASAAMQSLGALATLAGGSGGKNLGDQYVSLMQSVTVSNRVIDKFHLREVYGVTKKQDALRALAANIRFGLGKKDGLITVEVDDTDPQRAALIANNYVEQLKRITDELALTEAQQRRRFFEAKLSEVKNKLEKAQTELQRSGFNEGAIRMEPKANAESYAALNAQVTAAEVRLKAMRAYMTEEAAEFKLALANLNSLRSQLILKDVGSNLPSGSDYIGKYRDYKYFEILYELMAKQYELAKVDETRDGSIIQVLDVATPPEKKTKPKRIYMTLSATVAAAFIMSLLVIVRGRLQRLKMTPDGRIQLDWVIRAWRRN